MTNSNETIRNRNRDLTVCSAVPQPTAPPGAPTSESPYAQFSLVCSVNCAPQQYDSAVNSTQYTLSWILHVVTHFVELAARMYQLYSWKWLFKCWKMLEWRIDLIKLWLNNTRVNLSVVIWYSRRGWDETINILGRWMSRHGLNRCGSG